jgi:2-methylisocitrate lyase-like PEP mutase family enzyme
MGDLLGRQANTRQGFRELLSGGEPVLAPGAYDAMSARLVEAAGFPAVYMSGFGVTASLLGRPDIGLLGMSEMAQTARRIVAASADDIEKAASALAGERVLFSWGEGGRTPPTSIGQLREWGFSVVIFPIAALLASVAATRLVLARIGEDGTPIQAMAGLPDMAEFFGIIGLDEVDELGRRFGRG